MALKPTIFKFSVSLSDLERGYYDTLNLTIAQHPSETTERMMARVLAFCLNASEHLNFTPGLSTPDEPDISEHSLDGQFLLWVDVGEPGFERIKKASRIAKAVKVYSFNTKSDVWWRQEQEKFEGLSVSLMQFPWPDIEALAKLVQRTMELSVTITCDSVYIATPLGEVDVAAISLST
ncbi:MAG: YaeQ family protein [Gammaproteobacteria bacterium]|nr:YaeQ family protein [Gammaproteobacteria bacterium]MBT8151432.1 YaeQ family protein [Gammaproteobacteria bacterium]